AAQAAVAARVGLGDDEALYWTWAQSPGVLTVDHPPVVAWLIGLGTAVAGHTPLGVRLPFLICGLLTCMVLGAWVRRVAGEGAAAVAIVVFAVAPLFAVGRVFAAPDMPLWLFTALAGLALDHALDGGRLRAWLAAGLAVGLGLWTKLTMGLLPVGVLALLLLAPSLRPVLRSPGPWVASAVAAAVWCPWLVQQAAGDWPTLRFHLSGRHGAPPGIGGLLGSAAGQLAYLSPLVAGAVLFALVRPSTRTLRAWRLPQAIAIPPLVVFTVVGAFTRALPHWAGPGWLAGLVPAAALLSAHGRLRWVVLGLASAMSAAVHVQSVHPVLPLGPGDPTHDLHGWPAVGERLSQAAGVADENGCLPRLRGTRYQTAAQAEFSLRKTGGRVWPLARPLGRPAPTPEDPAERCGVMLVVASDRYPLERACPVLHSVPVLRGGIAVRELRIHRCP
ncbi:MAG: glycosyltransferase family 39 protein, partial [Myxococcota bacterium]|nr:glycosyltransferase family 39 protein [Myxococcota bacterium]